MELQTIKGVITTFEKIHSNKLRVEGEFLFPQTIRDKDGDIMEYKTSNGPSFKRGGKVNYGGIPWLIHKIEVRDTRYENLYECILTVSPNL